VKQRYNKTDATAGQSTIVCRSLQAVQIAMYFIHCQIQRTDMTQSK